MKIFLTEEGRRTEARPGGCPRPRIAAGIWLCIGMEFTENIFSLSFFLSLHTTFRDNGTPLCQEFSWAQRFLHKLLSDTDANFVPLVFQSFLHLFFTRRKKQAHSLESHYFVQRVHSYSKKKPETYAFILWYSFFRVFQLLTELQSSHQRRHILFSFL